MDHNITTLLTPYPLLLSAWNFIPAYFKEAFWDTIKFVPILFVLYYFIEAIEHLFIKKIDLFIKLVRRLGLLFSIPMALIPECGFSVLASIFYSRKLMTKGVLISYLVICSDDALPLLFMDFSKIYYIIPIILIKVVLGIALCFIVDFVSILDNRNIAKEIASVSTYLNNKGCCEHKFDTNSQPVPISRHAFVHTFNIFMFSLISLTIINCIIEKMEGIETASSFFMINSPLQIIGGSILGLIPNCGISVFITIAFLKGLVSFPTFLTFLISCTGLGLITLIKNQRDRKFDNAFITFILLVSSIIVGLLLYYGYLTFFSK